jgi:hypothetical protein
LTASLAESKITLKKRPSESMRSLRSISIFILALVSSAGALDHRDPGALPALAQLAELTASDGTSIDQFGLSVAVSGNTVVVGAHEAQIGSNEAEGAAYIFVKPSSGWTDMTQVAKLTPSNGSANFHFGWSVAISGDTVVVGTDALNGGAGAYVFVMPAGGWKDMTQTAELTYEDAGFSVGISGNVIVAGAPAAGVGSTFGAGAAFVYVKPKGGWVSTGKYTAELTASDGTNDSLLGYSVAISGNTVVAGALYATVGSTTDQGAAYVFVKPAKGWATATETAKLTASDGRYEDYLGTAVGISGNTIVAGAPYHYIPASYTGAEYVFVKPASGWTSTMETAELTGSSCHFGFSVAVSASEAVAGNQPSFCQDEPGAAYVYKMPKTGWKTTSAFTTELTAADGFDNNQFGASVSISGATIVVGAPFLFSPGAAYVF